MALDTGFAFFLGIAHLLGRAPALLFVVHGVVAMAVAAFAGVVGTHFRPDPLRHFEPLGLELLRRIDGAHHLMEKLVRRLDLAHQLRRPGARDMAIGTDGPDTGRVRVVVGLLVFLVDRGPHFVTRDAEILGVGVFHEGVEAAPEEDAGHAADNENDAPTVAAARGDKPTP